MHTTHQHSQPLGRQLEWQNSHTNAVPALGDNELHLWCLPLWLNENDSRLALNLLNETQHSKYQRRTTTNLKQAYLAGRFHLYSLLAAYTGIQARQIKLDYSRLGKPCLRHNPENIEFNFTDTCVNQQSVGLFVFCKNQSVGIDLEALTRRSDFDKIAAKRFSAAELSDVKLPSGKVCPERFLAYWTRKEAYGKAIGQGINFKMNEVDLANGDAFELNFHAPTPGSAQEKPFRLQQITVPSNLVTDQEFVASVVHSSHQNLSLRGFTDSQYRNPLLK